jgi:hypothetical protein
MNLGGKAETGSKRIDRVWPFNDVFWPEAVRLLSSGRHGKADGEQGNRLGPTMDTSESSSDD